MENWKIKKLSRSRKEERDRRGWERDGIFLGTGEWLEMSNVVCNLYEM